MRHNLASSRRVLVIHPGRLSVCRLILAKLRAHSVVRSRLPQALVLLLVLTTCLSALQGESRLIFPRFSFDSGTITGLAFMNPAGTAATVTLRAYGTDGKLLAGAGFKNQKAIQIPAGQQYARLINEIFESPLAAGSVGWIEATSPTDGVTGFFLFLSSSLSILDGADLPETAEQVVFNRVESVGDYTTELNLVNPGLAGGGEADVNIKLSGPGIAEINRNVKIPGKGMRRFDAGQLFGLAQIPAGSYVRAAADRPIAGFAFVRDRKGDLVGLNAVRERQQLAELYFPQMAVLGGFKTELGLVNYAGAATILTITAYREDGSLFAPPHLKFNPVNVSLDPRGATRLDVAELFGFSGNQLLNGWLKVTSTAPTINGFISYGIPSAGSSAVVASAAEGRKRALFSHLATTRNPAFFTGLALLNPGSVVANIRVLAFESSGRLIGSVETVLPPGQRISKLINELIPQADNRTGGFIWVKSDIPIYSTSLFGTGSLKVLANIPPQSAPDGFLPESGSELRLDPVLAPVQPERTTKFLVKNAQNQPVSAQIVWKVNGKVGGDVTIGTIGSDGTYTAPKTRPAQPVTISAEIKASASDPIRSFGASVDIVQKADLFSGLGVVRAVTYMQSLKKLYQTELTGTGITERAASAEPAAGPTSVISELSGDGGKLAVKSFSDLEISDMTPYLSSSGVEYLLLAARNTGQIIRFNPRAPAEQATIAQGLVEPTALVVDKGSGNLLVAERDRITTVQKSAVEAGLQPTPTKPTDFRTLRRIPSKRQGSTLITEANVSGLVVDDCSGDVYFTNASEGTLSVYRRGGAEVQLVTDQLFGPTDLLAIYRRGVSCPAALNLLVVERDAGYVSLVLPDSGFIYVWFAVPDAFDVEFMPEGNPFFPEVAGVLLGEFNQANGELWFVDLPSDYDAVPTNILLQRICKGGLFLADPDLEDAVKQALGIPSEAVIQCSQAEELKALNADQSEILFLDGLEYFPYLTDLSLYDNYVFDLTPLSELVNLEELDLSYNIVFDLEALYDLYYMEVLWLEGNFITDLDPLGEMWNIEVLDLSDNLISDVSPLAYHLGIDEGDLIDLTDNLLDLGDCADLQQIAIQVGEEGALFTDIDCTVLPNADLGVLVLPEPSPVGEFDELIYYIGIPNYPYIADSDATDVFLVGILPEQSIFLDYVIDGEGLCEVFAEIVLVCYFPRIELNTQLNLAVAVQTWGLAGDTMSSLFMVTSSNEYDPDVSDNKRYTEVPIVP